MIGRLGLLGLLLSASGARAQFEDAPAEEEGQVVEEADEGRLTREMRERLRSDPAVADSLAARISRSKVADRITGAEDPETRLQDIRKWIDADPQSAAGLAVGLAKDDASGAHSFEDMLTRTIRSKLQANPNSKNGIFGRLKKSSKDSKLLKAQSEGMSEEEQREILKNVFEGQGSQSGKIITQQDSANGEPGSAAGTTPSAAALNSSYYDRLSQANLRGYSPHLQAMQSALNLRRVPGAPPLIETGKLDFATLGYPAYGMRFDIGNLERRLRYERNYALAKLQGLEDKYSVADLTSFELEARLRSTAAEKTLSPFFSRRQRALERAAAAVREFDGAAAAAKNPESISRSLLMSLGAKQKEAARWITVASLEEELQRLEAEKGFLSAALIAAIARAPVELANQAAYRRRGETFDQAIKRLQQNDESAVKALEASDWLARLDAVEQTLASSSLLRRNLSRNIQVYQSTAYHFASSHGDQPRWRKIIDAYILRLFPGTDYARRLKRAERREALLKDVFLKIAMGDLDAAHTVLASADLGHVLPKK